MVWMALQLGSSHSVVIIVCCFVMMAPDVHVVLPYYMLHCRFYYGFSTLQFQSCKDIYRVNWSVFLGFILAVISIEGATKAYTALTMVVSLVALAFPIFDTLFAIVRRVLNKKPIGEGDRVIFIIGWLMGNISKYSVTILYVVSCIRYCLNTSC